MKIAITMTLLRNFHVINRSKRSHFKQNTNFYYEDPVDGLLLQKIRLCCSEVVKKEVK